MIDPCGLLVLHYPLHFVLCITTSLTFSLPCLLCLRGLPSPCEIDPLLPPPPLLQTRSRPPIHFQEQVYYGPSLYVLVHHGLPSGNVRLQFLQLRLLHRLRQRGVLPAYIGLLPRLIPCDQFHNLVVETHQGINLGNKPM